MGIMAVLREDEELSGVLYDICDVDLLPECRPPQNAEQRLSFSIAGKAFARDGSGGEYILLEDDSVGYSGSEGECGRIADSLSEFFSFMVNCPFWMDYRNREPYEQGDDALRAFARELMEEHREIAAEDLDLVLREAQQTLASALGIALYDDVALPVLKQFYRSAHRAPRLIATYTEQDGTRHSGSGTLFV